MPRLNKRSETLRLAGGRESAKRVGNSIYKFLRDKLQLPINREKSGIRRPHSFHVLGYGFVPTYKKGEKGKYQLVAEASKWKAFKVKLKALTKKTIPASFDERIQRINQLVRGWINYFKLGSIQQKLKKLEEWLRIEERNHEIQIKINIHRTKPFTLLCMASLEELEL
jgi:RNA-directed DNA polymerase